MHHQILQLEINSQKFANALWSADVFRIHSSSKMMSCSLSTAYNLYRAGLLSSTGYLPVMCISLPTYVCTYLLCHHGYCCHSDSHSTTTSPHGREVQCADKVTTVLYLTKTLVVETSYIAIIALVLLRECSPSLLLI